jgi:hypothetical protein
MSNLRGFSDDEIEQGIEELEERFRDKEILEIIDALLFITGDKR